MVAMVITFAIFCFWCCFSFLLLCISWFCFLLIYDVLSTFATGSFGWFFRTEADMPKIARVPKSQRLTFDDKQASKLLWHDQGSLDDQMVRQKPKKLLYIVIWNPDIYYLIVLFQMTKQTRYNGLHIFNVSMVVAGFASMMGCNCGSGVFSEVLALIGNFLIFDEPLPPMWVFPTNRETPQNGPKNNGWFGGTKLFFGNTHEFPRMRP